MKEVAVLNHVAGMKVGLSFVWKLNKFKYVRLLVGALAILSALSPIPASAQEQEEVRRGPVVIDEDKHDVSAPLRDIVLIGPQQGSRAKPLPHRRPGPTRVGTGPSPAEPSGPSPQVATTNAQNFNGIGTTGFAPPDPNASVGSTQVVETVNDSYQVFNKSNGASELGPVSIGNLWVGFGGVCETGNLSDPVVIYDKAAGRWLISILAFDNTFSTNEECIAVSTTSDATGSFHRYALSFGNDNNDYTKISAWPDAYYLTANIFQFGTSFIGPAACALDRTAMLAGRAATAQCFLFSTNDASLLASDLDGSTAPPANSPNFLMELGTSTTLKLFKFHVDFVTPSHTTLTGPTALTVPSFTDACGGSGGTCIPQPGTSQQLDSLGERLMFRLAYRNFGSHESLVASHSVTAGGGTAVRWYEIRSPNGTPAVFQSGTFAPDTKSRWVPSIAMDQSGDIALGYSLSSSSVFPSIAYTGRVPTDALGTMEAETIILTGSGSQTGGLSRWGDYTSMAIDPVDDCTFWYTNEYLPNNGRFNWATRIASFSFPSCGSSLPGFAVAATPSSRSVVQGNSTTYTATASAVNGSGETVTFSASGLPTGAKANFNPPSVTGSGSSTLTVSTTGSTPAGTHTITISGTSGTVTKSTTVSLTVNPVPTPDFGLSTSPSSVTITQGGRGSSAITIRPVNGFTGSVTFSNSTLPSGVTAAFGPNPATGSSTVTFSASSFARTGTATVSITATSGSLTHTTTVTLTVNPAPNFSLSASPGNVTIRRGNSGTSTITVHRTNGFTGSVAFSASSLPGGVTASFNPTSSTTATTLTLKVSSSANPGTFGVSVRGSSGGLTHSIRISLTVQ